MFKSMICCLGVSALVVGSTLLQAEPRPAAAPDVTRSPIEGEFAIESGEHGGTPIPAERIKGAMVRITASAITGTDKDRKEFFACTYTLEGNAQPWKIRMKSTAPKAGVESDGLVKRSGDTVTIIYALPGGDTPTDFKTKEKQHMFVLKNARAEKPNKENTFVPGSEK